MIEVIADFNCDYFQCKEFASRHGETLEDCIRNIEAAGWSVHEDIFCYCPKHKGLV